MVLCGGTTRSPRRSLLKFHAALEESSLVGQGAKRVKKTRLPKSKTIGKRKNPPKTCGPRDFLFDRHLSSILISKNLSLENARATTPPYLQDIAFKFP